MKHNIMQFNDGSDRVPELEKEKERLNKELEKDLNKKYDIAIKNLDDKETHKLHLKESSDKDDPVIDDREVVNDTYEPWGDAVEVYNLLEEKGLKEDFFEIIRKIYPEGLSDESLNDILSDKDLVLKILDKYYIKEN